MNPTQTEGEIDPPWKIGNYRVEERLGSGGMGIVYRAFDEVLQRPLAIKHLLSPGASPTASRRFRREAQVAARLNHPAIVHIYDIVETPAGDWIVMELVEGQTLAALVRDGGLELSAAVRLGREIAEGLAEAHAHGIVHRDLKTGNVMVTASGHAKILDFGLAKLVHPDEPSDLTQTGVIFGTYHAMSPEQAQGLPLDHRSDLFSFGVLLYEMFSGVSPFRAATAPETVRRICSLPHVPLHQIRQEVPRELSNLIDRLLDKEVTRRCQSALEVARGLEEIAPAIRPPAGVAGPRTRPPANGGQRPETSEESTLIENIAGNRAWGDLAPRSAPASSASDPSRPTGERRQMTVVCCELVGADGPSSRLSDLEVLYEWMLQLRTLAGEVAGRYGGHLGSTPGHRVLIQFGYPQTHEDNARRAVLTALELAGEVARMKAGAGPGDPGRLALRVGVHTGPAVVATSPQSLEPVMLGATLDAAIELQALADPGGVVVSPATGALIQKSFSLAPLPPVVLPGHATPWIPLRVLAPLHSPEDSAEGAATLVGRERELDLLLSRWSLVAEGTGQAVLVSGEAGIGKSRLVHALRERLGGAVKWLSCGGSPYTQSSPLRPVIDLLRQAIAPRAGASPLDRLEDLLCDHSLAEAVPLVATLLDLPLDGRHAAPNLAPERQRDKTLEALVAWVLDMAERQPLVLLIEDLHWLDPTTLNWLGRLIDQVPAAPLLLVLTLRLPAAEPLHIPLTQLTQITLSPLSEAEARLLIDQVTGPRPLAPEIRRQIVARTDGVPLFLEELTKAVLEASPEETRELPATLRDSLAARLDRLGSAKEIAQLASVIGRVFSLEVLAAVSLQDEATLLADLRQLIQAELIYRKGFGAQTRYLFKHALVQDAAYDSLLKRERQQLHRRIAEALESRFPETVETQPELLAHHYAGAGLAETAAGFWLRAGRIANGRSANSEAVIHFQQALGLLESRPESRERHRRELEVQSALAAALIAGRGFLDPAVEQAYARAEALAGYLEETEERFWAVVGLHTCHVASGDFVQALHLAERLLRIAEESGSPILLSIAHFWLGTYLYYRADFAAALPQLERAFELAPPADDTYRRRTGVDLRVLTLCFGALVLWHLGYPARAWSRGEQAVALARELGHPFTLSFARGLGGAVLAHYRRDAPAARREARAVLDLAAELDFPLWIWQSTFLLVWACLEAPADGAPPVELGAYGDPATIEKLAGSGMDYYFCLYAEILRLQGRAGAALAALERCLPVARQRGAAAWTGELHRLQGEILRTGPGGGADRVEELFRTALELARQCGSRSLELRAAVSLGSFWRSQGREAEARDLVAGVHAGFSEGFETQDLREAGEFLGARPGEPR